MSEPLATAAASELSTFELYSNPLVLSKQATLASRWKFAAVAQPAWFGRLKNFKKAKN